MRHPLLIMFLLAGSVGIVQADEKPPELKISDEEQAIVDATNAERKKAELPLLKPNAKLFAAARSHAANMAKQDMLEHTLDEKSTGDRVKALGYKFARIGENIARNQNTPKEVLEGWMNSEDHKENILTKEYTEIGVAIAKNEKEECYWIQVFGTPR
ncbi:CAP domain-containing protein [Zavarzinella formosa]|uniref:CAP domain-containing protein n=1 Tax=Zavarzinella formosa TaxID=360055 RepID=UPI0003091C05|nr:CAP domain-containing protein [Zavarzinella formosa]